MFPCSSFSASRKISMHYLFIIDTIKSVRTIQLFQHVYLWAHGSTSLHVFFPVQYHPDWQVVIIMCPSQCVNLKQLLRLFLPLRISSLRRCGFLCDGLVHDRGLFRFLSGFVAHHAFLYIKAIQVISLFIDLFDHLYPFYLTMCVPHSFVVYYTVSPASQSHDEPRSLTQEGILFRQKSHVSTSRPYWFLACTCDTAQKPCSNTRPTLIFIELSSSPFLCLCIIATHPKVLNIQLPGRIPVTFLKVSSCLERK